MMSELEHRRGTASLRILNPDGTPAAHRAVRVDQVSHRFLFGCGAFDAIAMNFVKEADKKAALARRMEKWLGLFNYGTLPFYWGRYEPVEGKTAYAETMAAAKWLREKGVQVKGHPLCWHTVCAPWLMQYSNEEILRRQLERIHRDVSAYKGVVDMWDVINEVVIMPVFDKYDNAITRICKDVGRIKLVREVFAAAKESNPDAVLLINDFNTSVSYEILLEGLLEAGVDAPAHVVPVHVPRAHQHVPAAAHVEQHNVGKLRGQVFGDHGDAAVHLTPAVDAALVHVVLQHHAEYAVGLAVGVLLQHVPQGPQVEALALLRAVQVRVFKGQVDDHDGQHAEGVHHQIAREQYPDDIAHEQRRVVAHHA